MAEYTLCVCFMSILLHETIARTDDTCYSVHKIRALLHKKVTMTGLLDERLIELINDLDLGAGGLKQVGQEMIASSRWHRLTTATLT